jgi:PAS domain S-box-containing protein
MMLKNPTIELLHENLAHIWKEYIGAITQSALVFFTDPKGNYIYVNLNFTRTTGYQTKELIGNPAYLVQNTQHSRTFLEEIHKKVIGGSLWTGNFKIATKLGKSLLTHANIAAIKNEKGQLSQFLCIMSEVTDPGRTELKLLELQQEIRKKEIQLKDAQKVSKTGSWFRQAGNDLLEWSDETYDIFEIPRNTAISIKRFEESIHPADLKTVLANWDNAMQLKAYETEHRIITSSGEKWVNERARIDIDEETGLFRSAFGTVQDITQKKKTEFALRESEKLYKAIFNNSPFSMGIADKKTLKCLNVNRTACGLYGYTKKEFLNLNSYDIWLPDDHEKFSAILASGKYTSDRNTRVHRKKNGELIYVDPSITEINYEGSKAFLITVVDVTEKKKMQEEINLTEIKRQKEILSAQEQSRTSMGRELHDNINQLLAAAGLYIKNSTPASARDKEMVDIGLEILSKANDEIRKLSAALVAPSLQHVSLQDLLRDFAVNYKPSKIRFHFDIKLEESKLNKDLKVNIYRIIQELLTNVVKYAQATDVHIFLEQSAATLVLRVTDNGIGFNAAKKSAGIGLQNILYRTEAYNGILDIQSSAGNGCRVQVIFNLS